VLSRASDRRRGIAPVDQQQLEEPLRDVDTPYIHHHEIQHRLPHKDSKF